MKDLEKSKHFNNEDINSDKKQNEEFLETTSLEENMDELDEIMSEDEESQDFVDEEEEIKFNEEPTKEVTVEEIKTEENEVDFEKEKEKIMEEYNKTHDLSSETDLMEEIKEDSNDASLESIVNNDYQEETIVDMEVPKGNKIGIASDHRGYKLKQKLTKYLTNKGYTVIDFGTDGKASVDYPEFGFKLGEAIADFEVEKGIAICGSGIGISIACNKIKGVRCAKVDNVKEVKYARKDNDANVIAIAGNMPCFRAKDIVDAYLNTSFTGLDRHKRRIEMLNNRG